MTRLFPTLVTFAPAFGSLSPLPNSPTLLSFLAPMLFPSLLEMGRPGSQKRRSFSGPGCSVLPIRSSLPPPERANSCELLTFPRTA